MWAMHTSCTMTHIHTDAQVQLPLAGRELTDYDCKPTETGCCCIPRLEPLQGGAEKVGALIALRHGGSACMEHRA